MSRLLVPRLLWRLIRLSFRYGPPKIIRIRIRGADIVIKNNARLAYSESHPSPDMRGRVSAKIALPSEYRSGSLAREIRARRFLKRCAASPPVPMLFDYDQKKLRWIKEEFIAVDKMISASEKALTFLDCYACEFYFSFARSRPLQLSLRMAGIAFEDIQEVLKESGASISGKLETLTWPVAMVHGDLTPGNMIAAQNGGLVVVDWEKFGRGPVARDLTSLYKFHPRRTLDVLGAISQSNDLSPLLQMQVAFAMELVALRRNHANMLSYFERHLGMDRRASIEKLDATESSYITQIAGGTSGHPPRQRE